MKKQFLTKICVGVPNASYYAVYDLKKPLGSFRTIDLQGAVDRIKTKLNDGEVILNTNLEKLGIKI
jgi:hypothetical protein